MVDATEIQWYRIQDSSDSDTGFQCAAYLYAVRKLKTTNSCAGVYSDSTIAQKRTSSTLASRIINDCTFGHRTSPKQFHSNGAKCYYNWQRLTSVCSNSSWLRCLQVTVHNESLQLNSLMPLVTPMYFTLRGCLYIFPLRQDDFTRQ